MFQLKEYQQKALDALKSYFQTTNLLRAAGMRVPARHAFAEVTLESFGQSRPYNPVPGLEGLPYVCLRMPTGAGKTFVACYAAKSAAQDLVQADHPLILWLVPSNAILKQTVAALKDRNHPYRQALDAEFGNVTVLDRQEALAVTPAMLLGGATILVSTIQAFRVDDTEGRKVYEESGALMGHFDNLPTALLRDLDCHDNGQPKRSLANVLRLHRPIVLVDEAHNVRTPLSFETLTRFRPSCIVEFTATPDTKQNPSNVLHAVSAAELKAEEMVKLPIILHTNPNWRDLLSDAIARLNDLQRQADLEKQHTGEYVRPVMLIQAQPRSHPAAITVDVIRNTLIEDFGVSPEAIARDAYDYNELDRCDDIRNVDCPIRFVITITSLQEGWDCPTAYVLCSVAELSSGTAVEQILGRIMRLPNVRRKDLDDLNQAYAFGASSNFGETARALIEGLVQNGFDRVEAATLVQVPEQLPLDTDFSDLPMFAAIPQPITIAADLLPPDADIPQSLADRLQVDRQSGDLQLTGPLNPDEVTILYGWDPSDKWRNTVDRTMHDLRQQYVTLSPAQRGETFTVPVLALQQGELPLSAFSRSHFIGILPLAQMDASLTPEDFPDEPAQTRQGRIDVGPNQDLRFDFIDELHHEVRLLASDQDWDRADLVLWLDRTLPRPKSITQHNSLPFINNALDYLLNTRGLSLDRLVHDKYRLRAALATRIEKHFDAYQKMQFQPFLLEDTTPLIVTDDPEISFTYDPHAYPCPPYRGQHGNFNFKKHYYDTVGDLNGEEFGCAAHLDMMTEVEFWVRNPVKSVKAFSLQTSTDRFYPDFVCKLTDGRYLVVEYKGRDRIDNPEEVEKDQLGHIWEKLSDGRCLFLMVTDNQYSRIDAKVTHPLGDET
jgi:type III restriction enzyme